MNSALEMYTAEKRRFGHWDIKQSPLGGRGLFATSDMNEKTEIFREKALVIGPRASKSCPPVCVACHKTGLLIPCPSGCGLFVCLKACPAGETHRECSILAILNDLEPWQRMAFVAPLRSAFLSQNEREILKSLEQDKNDGFQRQLEKLSGILNPQDLEIVKICSQVFNATAYETPTAGGGSLRGIYPMAALLNHDCTPNTWHYFDYDGAMVVETAKPLKTGDELTTSYTCLTWGSSARQVHLKKTKGFDCRCQRCLDPSEYGSKLMGLFCIRKGCEGVLLPLQDTLDWKCQLCRKNIPRLRMAAMQQIITKAVMKFPLDNLKESCKLLQKNLLVPSCNYYAVEFKIHLIRLFGHESGFSWDELSIEELSLKMILCEQVNLLLTILQIGWCSLREFVSLEIRATKNEFQRRNVSFIYK